MEPSLPSRKSVSSTCRVSLSHRSSSQTPLQVLVQMGFQKHRAEKALAATGYQSPQLAAEWLLHHVNDPTIDDNQPREYILYLCPKGQLLEQIETYYAESQNKTGWNGAHNYLPHITLCSFFQAPDEAVGLLINALQHCVEKMKGDLPTSLKLSFYKAQQFIGLYVNEEQNDILKRLATMYMRECSEFITSELGPMHVISTCFPWCSSYPVLNPKRIEVEPYLKSLHVTLAYQFEESKKEVLEDLLKLIDLDSSCNWELRLYSREQRVKGQEVHKVLFPYAPQELDEMELGAGDYVYINPDTLKTTSDSWTEGTSWRSGCAGQFPLSYVQRVPESSIWTILKNISLAEGNGCASGTFSIFCDNLIPPDQLDNHSIETSASETTDGRSSVSESSRTLSNGSDVVPRLLIVSRHAERIDFTFGNWIPYCFDAEGNYSRKDLNQPMTLPKRASPQEYFKDSPLTIVGLYQATLTGQAFKASAVTVTHAYASPAFRCIQTCTNILKELNLMESVPISVEPGLFEWMAWYPEPDQPKWMTPEQFKENGYNINLDYKPLFSYKELLKRQNESSEDYYDRSHLVSTTVLAGTTGNVLLVGHAASLDTCTRQLTGNPARNEREVCKMVHKIPYCGISTAEESPLTKQWTLVKPPILTLQHTGNQRYDWKILKGDKEVIPL